MLPALAPSKPAVFINALTITYLLSLVLADQVCA
jgi:hypothetical protein